MNKEVFIREYKVTDIPKIQDLIKKVLNEYGWDFDDYDYDVLDMEKYYPHKSKSRSKFFVMIKDNELIGTAAFMDKGNDCAELRKLFLKKEERGKGYGKMLNNNVVSACKSEGFKKATFLTDTKLDIAVKMYNKVGYKIIEQNGSELKYEVDLVSWHE